MFGRFRRRGYGVRRMAAMLAGVVLLAGLGRAFGPRHTAEPWPLAEGEYRVASVHDDASLELLSTNSDDANRQPRPLKLLGLVFTDDSLPRAVASLRERAENRVVRLTLDSHRSNEQNILVGHLSLDGQSLSGDLVRQGLARVDRRAGNSRALAKLAKLQREAQLAKLGIWAADSSTVQDDAANPPDPADTAESEPDESTSPQRPARQLGTPRGR